MAPPTANSEYTVALPTLVVLMALFMFWGAEQLERIFGGADSKKAPRARYAGAGVLLAAAVGVAGAAPALAARRGRRLALVAALLVAAGRALVALVVAAAGRGAAHARRGGGHPRRRPQPRRPTDG